MIHRHLEEDDRLEVLRAWAAVAKIKPLWMRADRTPQGLVELSWSFERPKLPCRTTGCNYTPSHGHHYCYSCLNKHRPRRRRTTEGCELCGKSMTGRARSAIYCSKTCRTNAWHKMNPVARNAIRKRWLEKNGDVQRRANLRQNQKRKDLRRMSA